MMILGGLDEMAPGPELAVLLAELDLDELSGLERVVVLRAHTRMVSYYQALLYADMAAIADAVVVESGDPSDEQAHFEGGAAEIRVPLRLTRRWADCELGWALCLRDRLSRLWEALVSGCVDWRRVRVLGDGTAHLGAEETQMVVDEVLERAGGWTTGQLRGPAPTTVHGALLGGGEGTLWVRSRGPEGVL